LHKDPKSEQPDYHHQHEVDDDRPTVPFRIVMPWDEKGCGSTKVKVKKLLARLRYFQRRICSRAKGQKGKKP